MKEMQYDELAEEFVRCPIEVYGVYRTKLARGNHYGHRHKPTTRCALVIALKGKATFAFNDASRTMEVGRALLGGVNMRLEIEVHTAEFEYFLVHYLPVGFEPGRPLRMTAVSELRTDLEPNMLQAADRLLQLAAEPGNLALLEKRTLFYRLIGMVLLSERYQHNKDSYPMMEQAIRFIRDNYMEPITLESLSERYGAKPKYFSHLFHKFTGVSPIHYLIRYRMNRAYELLETTHFSVGEVAASVGYADAYYFSRLFKKQHGISPKEAKRQGSGNNPS